MMVTLYLCPMRHVKIGIFWVSTNHKCSSINTGGYSFSSSVWPSVSNKNKTKQLIGKLVPQPQIRLSTSGKYIYHTKSLLFSDVMSCHNKRAMMALYRSPELLWTVQNVAKILLRFDLVTYFWTQSHPLSRQTFWYRFIKIEAKLWPLEG